MESLVRQYRAAQKVLEAYKEQKRKRRVKQQRKSSKRWREHMLERGFRKIEVWVSPEDYEYLLTIKRSPDTPWMLVMERLIASYRFHQQAMRSNKHE